MCTFIVQMHCISEVFSFYYCWLVAIVPEGHATRLRHFCYLLHCWRFSIPEDRRIYHQQGDVVVLAQVNELLHVFHLQWFHGSYGTRLLTKLDIIRQLTFYRLIASVFRFWQIVAFDGLYELRVVAIGLRHELHLVVPILKVKQLVNHLELAIVRSQSVQCSHQCECCTSRWFYVHVLHIQYHKFRERLPLHIRSEYGILIVYAHAFTSCIVGLQS